MPEGQVAVFARENPGQAIALAKLHPTKIREIIGAVTDPSALFKLADEFPDHVIGVVHQLPLQAQWILGLIEKHPTQLAMISGALRHTKAFNARGSVRFLSWLDSKLSDDTYLMIFCGSIVGTILGCFRAVSINNPWLGLEISLTGFFLMYCSLVFAIEGPIKKFLRFVYNEAPPGIFLAHLFPKHLPEIVRVLAEVAPGEIPKLAKELPRRAIDIAIWAPETVLEIAKALPSHAPALAAAFQDQALIIAELVPEKLPEIKRRVPDAFKLEESTLPRPVVPLTPESTTTLPRPAGNENDIAPKPRR